MSNENLGVLTILSTAYDQRKKVVAEMISGGEYFGENEKTAAAPQSNTQSDDLEYVKKLAQACFMASEHEYHSRASGRAADQPASTVGPKDNEVRSVSSGHFRVPIAKKLKTGKGAEVNKGEVRPLDNEDREGLDYTGSSSALPKTAAEFLAKAASNYRVLLGTNGLASGQPASSIGPDDNETGSKSSRISGGRISGDPMQVVRLTAQELEGDAQRTNFPFSEPQAYEIASESGPGAGPHSSSIDGPIPNKTAAAFLLSAAASLRGAK